MVCKKTNCITIYKNHTYLVCIATQRHHCILFHWFLHCTKPEQEGKNWKLCIMTFQSQWMKVPVFRRISIPLCRPVNRAVITLSSCIFKIEPNRRPWSTAWINKLENIVLNWEEIHKKFDCLAIFSNVFNTNLEVLSKKVSIVSQCFRMFLILFWRYSRRFWVIECLFEWVSRVQLCVRQVSFLTIQL